MLAEAKHNNDTLEQMWNDGKRDAITETVNKIEGLKEEERTELIEILDCHYDPEKKSIKPVTKQSSKPQQSQQQQQQQQQPRRRMPRNRNMNKENRNRGGRQRNKSNDSNKKFYSNNNNSSQVNNNNNNSHTNNNNMMTSTDTMKSGGVRKDFTQVDSNQNIISAST